MNFKVLSGSALAPAISDLAHLRIRVFREFPYLYDGSIAYEAKYLEKYLNESKSLCVLAYSKDQIVGASTGLPLSSEVESVREPLRHSELGAELDQVFYFGESVLLPEYRGLGIGKKFFDEREKFARDQSFKWTTFCAVIRKSDHPDRPPAYRPLDEFWQSRGYHKLPECFARMSWQDLREDQETEKLLQFWARSWA